MNQSDLILKRKDSIVREWNIVELVVDTFNLILLGVLVVNKEYLQNLELPDIENKQAHSCFKYPKCPKGSHDINNNTSNRWTKTLDWH